MAVDAPIQPYLEVNCPTCGTPNCFDYGLRKDDMPVNCVDCNKPFRLRIAVRSVDANTDHKKP